MKALLMAACVCCTASLHAGEVYKWTDEGGGVHYGNVVPPARRATATPVDTSNPVEAGTPHHGPEAHPAPKREPVFTERRPRPAAAAHEPALHAPEAAASCEEAWRRYNDSAACFEPYRIKGGRVRPEAYQHCVDVPRPDPCD
jgi:hypothetical protein